MEALAAPPPRRVTLSGIASVLLRGWLVQIGSLVLGVGMLAFWTYVLGSPLFNPEPVGPGLVPTSGLIVGAAETGSFDTGEVVVRYVYEYSVGQETYFGRAHTSDWVWEQGQRVEVQVDPERPELSRIPGARKARFGPGSERAGLFPLFGAALIAAGAFANAKKLALLARGRVAKGRVAERRNTLLGGYRFLLRYKDADGEVYRFHVRASDPEPFARGRRPVLYDTRRPERAILTEDVADILVSDERGELVPPPRALKRTLLVPCAALLPHAVWGLWRLFS